MNTARLPEWCMRIGIIYLVIGMCVGAFMGATDDFSLRDVHAHFNLLGYASTFLMGLLLKTYPSSLKSKMTAASVFFVLIAVGSMLALLMAFYLLGDKFGNALNVASFATLLAYIVFAVTVFRITAKTKK